MKSRRFSTTKPQKSARKWSDRFRRRCAEHVTVNKQIQSIFTQKNYNKNINRCP